MVDQFSAYTDLSLDLDQGTWRFEYPETATINGEEYRFVRAELAGLSSNLGRIIEEEVNQGGTLTGIYEKIEIVQYVCPTCGAAFTSQADLNAHMATHDEIQRTVIAIALLPLGSLGLHAINVLRRVRDAVIPRWLHIKLHPWV